MASAGAGGIEHERNRISQLIAKFAWQVDRGAGVGVEDLFTDTGLYAMGGVRLEGRAAIRDFYSARRAGERVSRHLFSNVVIEVVDERIAHATSLLTLHAGDGAGPHSAAPVLIADYDDQLVLDEASVWRFARRDVTPVFGDPLPPVAKSGP